MSFLRFLEGLRNPVCDAFFSTVTHLGEETFFIVFGLIFFWCINKKEGYYLLSIGFIGTIVNQFLKLWFRVPRPWVKDKDFTIVEAAKAEATGYSFPSGHTQSSVGVFGGIARFNKKLWIRIICILACVLVPLSRMYLGVHTPADVLVSVALSLILVFGLYPLIQKCFYNTKIMRILLISMVVLSAGLLAFVLFYNFPSDVDLENLSSGIKNAYKMLGCTLGIYIAFEIDNKFINFDTSGSLISQILKFVLGLIPLIGIKEGLRFPLNAIFGGSYLADGVRYLLIVLFAGCVWPLTFKWFAKIGRK
ncbi:MAG: phosphatase PAP2 family protein [Acutalibacteraceae bacterium]|nr:phosphatase PAP2 family protein [Acutalibacteraceae bacterium]